MGTPLSPPAVVCDVCGRENPPHLTFCQDCGRRLKEREMRGVAPTPPTGLAKVDLAPKSVSPGRSRPEAPAFAFSPAAPAASPPAREPVPSPVAPAAAKVPEVAAPAVEPLVCPTCSAPNPVAYRFCVACGASIRPAKVVAPVAEVASPPIRFEPARTSDEPRTSESRHAAPPPAPAPTPSPAPVAVAPAPIAGAPVVEIASSRAQPLAAVTCTRCQGQSPGGTRFCRFCGAGLVESARPGPNKRAREEASAAVYPQPAEAKRRPGSTRRPRLVVIVEDGSEGETYPLDGSQIDVGRVTGDILLPEDPYVSPRHARITFDGAAFAVRDLGSTNGVYIRLRRVCPLQHGDRILVGLEVLQLEIAAEAERSFGPAMEHGTALFGSPAVSREARLCQRTVEGVTRDVYHLFRDDTVLGRESGDIVFSADPFLSRRHAVIRRDPKTRAFSIEDLGSSNGTYVAIRRETPLSRGDFIRMGQHLFRVDLD